MRWRKATLIGVGLLGGSLGLALRKRGLAECVHGYVRRESSFAECLEAGAVDEVTTDLHAAVAKADLIVFCTPLAQMARLGGKIAESVERGTLLTDVGSVKGELVQELEPIFEKQGATFVGSHPMAGSEKMGVLAARENLFEGAACVITPGAKTPEPAIQRIEELWRGVGASPFRLSPDVHDQIVARSSHLPHVLAAHLASYVLAPHQPPEQARLCANGFKDSTRIASGSPEMWRDIVMMNKEHVLRSLKEFSSNLAEFALVLERDDPEEIEAFFRNAKALRDGWAAGGSRSPE